MSLKTVLTALADAIRSKSGLSGAMTLEQMTEAVSGIQQGGIDTSDATATEEDMAEGVTAYVNGEKITGTVFVANSMHFWDGGIVETGSSSTIRINKKYTKPCLEKKGVIISVKNSEFGDAAAEDVAAGKTFTSAAGLKVTGTKEESGNSVETFHITFTSDTITPKGSGTVKVWGYGYYSSGTYSKTTYAFVGDGYYTASSYGTPSKTSATFGINADGTLSGLPSNVSTVDLLVTIGI